MPEETTGTGTQPGAGGTPAPGAGGGTAGQAGQAAPGSGAGGAQSFEEWLKGQDETVRTLASEHVKGLKGALDSERAQRKDFEKQLRDAAGKLEKDSTERKGLEDLAGKLQGLERQTAFFDAAHGAGVTNLRLAWLAAQEAELVDDRGRADFGKLKERFPELFRAPAPPPGNAGAGTQTPPSRQTMNDLIRRAAGRT
jgi:hypothetical protein